jgi:predicted nucleotidyltransferase
MIDLIDHHRTALSALCRQFHVKTLELFGSAVDGTFDAAHSDLDFLVEFLPAASTRTFHAYFDLRDALQQLFGRDVDLIMPSAIRNPYLLETVSRRRKVLYAV